jgi:hypothetical protein
VSYVTVEFDPDLQEARSGRVFLVEGIDEGGHPGEPLFADSLFEEAQEWLRMWREDWAYGHFKILACNLGQQIDQAAIAHEEEWEASEDE